MKFNVGDRVSTYSGKTGTVCHIHLDGDDVFIGVKMDNPGWGLHDCQNNCEWGLGRYWCNDQLELITPAIDPQELAEWDEIDQAADGGET